MEGFRAHNLEGTVTETGPVPAATDVPAGSAADKNLSETIHLRPIPNLSNHPSGRETGNVIHRFCTRPPLNSDI